MRHIPSWVPGAGFQRIADRARQLCAKMFDGPVVAVEAAMVNTQVLRAAFGLPYLECTGQRKRNRVYDLISSRTGVQQRT